MRLSFALLSLAIAMHGARAQSPAAAYISTNPKGDTLVVETYTRTPQTVVGEIHAPSAHQRLSYTLSLGTGDLVSRMDVQVRPDTGSPTAPPSQAFTVAFAGDSIHVAVGSNAKAFAAKPGSLPWINPSFSLIEQIVRRAHHLDPQHARVDSLPLFDLNSGPVMVAVSWKLPDSAVIQFPNITGRAEVDLFDHVTGVLFPDGSVMHARQLHH